jgi:HEAT repeat protein
MIPLEVTPKPGKIVRVGVVLASRLEGVEAIEKQAREWIARLDDSDYKVREQATKALGELGPPAVPLLQRALETATGAEVKIRLKTLLDAEDASEYLKVEPAAGPRKGR